MRHVVTLETWTVPVMVYSSPDETGYRFRWRCSCEASGDWRVLIGSLVANAALVFTVVWLIVGVVNRRRKR